VIKKFYLALIIQKEKDILKFAKEETGKVIYQVEITNELQFDQQEGFLLFLLSLYAYVDREDLHLVQ
jgi:hypothetical protein